MKPSEKIREIINENKLFSKEDISIVDAILIYLDEEWDKKQMVKEIREEAIEELKKRVSKL